MKCSVILQSHHNNGNINMKTLNSNMNPYNKDCNIDVVVDQLCMKLQDIKDQESGVGRMHLDQSDAVRKYYAAFPALTRTEPAPVHYRPPPPPAWCRTRDKDSMHCDLVQTNDWNKKKLITGKERRNSYHGQRKFNKKRCNSYSRSLESKEEVPEWMNYEGEWDMESRDPVREFIRAIAQDEGYGTCDNTLVDDIRPRYWEERLKPEEPRARTPLEEEMYAKFEAKFNSSIEALWSDTPDDDYQDLPIDFHDLLSSPSDRLFYEAPPEKTYPSLTESIWSNDAFDSGSKKRAESPSGIDGLHDRFEPLNLADTVFSTFNPEEPFSFFSFDGIYDAIPSVTDAMRSLSALNHSRNHSCFAEVVPRRYTRTFSRAVGPARPAVPRAVTEDLLTSARTHFRPIRTEPANAAPRYRDGDTFVVRADVQRLAYRRSDSGYFRLDSSNARYLEYRALKFAVRRSEVGVQTEGARADGDRKRRHSAALRCPAAGALCPHPHAPFVHCCAVDRPLTR